MGRKLKTNYVQYDYEEAYQKQLDMEDEYTAQQILKGKSKKTVYATKEIRSGEQLEVEIYPEFTKGQQSEIPTEAQKKKQKLAHFPAVLFIQVPLCQLLLFLLRFRRDL